MELQEFIAKTLVDIKTGVSEANKTLAELEGKKMGVDAHPYFAIEPHGRDKKEGYINFDIAVTVTQETKTTGGGGIKIAVASLGGEISDSGSQESISRIKFHVLPYFTIA